MGLIVSPEKGNRAESKWDWKLVDERGLKPKIRNGIDQEKGNRIENENGNGIWHGEGRYESKVCMRFGTVKRRANRNRGEGSAVQRKEKSSIESRVERGPRSEINFKMSKIW